MNLETCYTEEGILNESKNTIIYEVSNIDRLCPMCEDRATFFR